MEPTDLQKDIINSKGNVVVLASPGSGKTYVLSEMIRRVLRDEINLDYQGVIALSYTREASSHLKKRTLGDGLFDKNSFFGTIDSFCLMNIIECYGTFVFGHPVKELEVIGLNDLDEKQKKSFAWIDKIHPDYSEIDTMRMQELSKLFLQGSVLVESLVLLAVHIIKKSAACRKYLQARFRYIFIDEYQDADTYTNELFLMLVNMGLYGVAVGDANQSIFGFAHKKSEFLKALTKKEDFLPFSLGENFRCSLPIINYSNRLLDSNSQVYNTDKSGMYLVRVKGDEYCIANFIDNKLKGIAEQWKVSDNSEVAILVKNKRTLKLIDECLETPHRVIKTTSLDMDLNLRSHLYALLLRFYFDENIHFLSILDEYVNLDTLSIYTKKKLFEESRIIKSVDEVDIEQLLFHFKTIADILLPKIPEGYSIDKLKLVLSNEEDLDSYRPLSTNELQLMTLHKSKGLEFDVVFHLNVSEWEMPLQRIVNNDWDHPIYPHWEEDLNLHYVGITRARKACYLVRGTQRRNNNDELKSACDSKFLSMNNLDSMREEICYGF